MGRIVYYIIVCIIYPLQSDYLGAYASEPRSREVRGDMFCSVLLYYILLYSTLYSTLLYSMLISYRTICYCIKSTHLIFIERSGTSRISGRPGPLRASRPRRSRSGYSYTHTCTPIPNPGGPGPSPPAARGARRLQPGLHPGEGPQPARPGARGGELLCIYVCILLVLSL